VPLAGALAAIVTVVAEGRLGPRTPDTANPTSWLTILASRVPGASARAGWAALEAVAALALCACWLLLVARARAGAVSARRTGLVACAWSLPYLVGPPLFSRDVYAYVAQGRLAGAGLDPSTHGVSALRGPGARTLLASIDPRWRETRAPYGGTAVALEKTVAHLPGIVAPVLALRVIAALAVTVTVLAALELARRLDPTGREPAPAAVVALLAANPVTMIFAVGGAHLDAIAAALLLVAVLLGATAPGAADAPARGRRAGAVCLATLAATIKITTVLGLLWLIVAAAWATVPPSATGGSAHSPGRFGREARPDRRRRWRGLAADLAVAALSALASMAAAGFPPTWLHALATSTASGTGIAPASVLATAIGIGGLIVGAHGVADAVTPACRVLALAAGAAAVVTLLARYRRGRCDGAAVLGYGSFAIALGGPVLYPWYLAAGLPFLAVSSSRRALRLVAVTSVVLVLTSLSSLTPTWRWLGRHPLLDAAAGAALVAAAALLALLALRADRPEPPERPERPEPPAPAEPGPAPQAAGSR